MKTSGILTLAGALLACASPIDKRAMKTEWVTDIIWVTVTVDASIATTRVAHFPAKASTTSISMSTTSTSIPTTTPLTSSSSSLSSTSSSASSSSSVIPIPVPVPETTTTSITPPVVVPTSTTSTAAAATTIVEVQAAATFKLSLSAEASSTSPSSESSSTTASSEASSSPTDFASTAVYHHNIHRANHSAPAASWNSDLASYAATVAAKCVFAHDLTPGSDTGSYGQNIAMYGSSGDIESTSHSSVIAQAITEMWYNGEVWQYPEDGYGADTPDMTNFESWGHFSQLVWVASTEVGCAVQYCSAGTLVDSMASYFSVCNYRSAGNMGGDYGTNVLKPLGGIVITV